MSRAHLYAKSNLATKDNGQFVANAENWLAKEMYSAPDAAWGVGPAKRNPEIYDPSNDSEDVNLP